MLQLLSLLLTFVGLGSTCPNMCTCRHFPRELVPKNYLYYTSVKCNVFSGNLTLENTTRILEVWNLNEENFSEFLQSLVDSDLPQLNTLVIKNCAVQNFSDSLNILGDKISYLTLAQNGLTFLPGLCNNVSRLKSLDLSHNKIKFLPAINSLRTLRTLEILNLSANSMFQIKSDSFSHLTNLKCLDLSRNDLSQLENEVLTPLSSLQYLNLSQNHLEVLNEQCFSSLIMLQQLDVSWNSLARVAPGSLQLPSLARLLLAGNPRLGESREVLVGAGRKLQSVDASQTGLEQVPAALTHSIRTLRLAGNSIKSISCGDLDFYPLLQLLDFASNDINYIEEDALGRLESLFILYLSDNKIQEIPRSLPEALSVLHLEFNNIKKVSRDDLEGLERLEVLLLNDNKIRIVEEGAFKQLLSLVTLDLSRNPISALHPGSLTGPTALQMLRLASVEIVSPAEDVSFPLSTPDHLISLDLSGSPGLARQLLADTAALAASRELQELNLSGADLEFIRSDLLHFLSQLRIMHIKDNRLNCTQLQWLAAWMRRQDQAEYRGVVCASPPDLWGTPLVDLQYVEISPIKYINQVENSRDIKGSINPERKRATTESSSPVGKYATQKMFNTTDKVTNGFINSSFAISTAGILKESVTMELPVTEVIYFEVEKIKDNESIDKGNNENLILNLNIADKDTKTRKYTKGQTQITAKKKTMIKSKDQTLVSSADPGRSSLIPVTNGRKKYSTTKLVPTEFPQVVQTESGINQPGKVAISETASTKEPRNDRNYLENLPARNSNEPAGALNKAEAPLNLILDERILNNTLAPPNNPNKPIKNNFDNVHRAVDVNITESTSQWNASTMEMSMYTNTDRQGQLLHPGMLILAAGLLCGAAALAMLAAKFNSRKKRASKNLFHEDIEVGSFSSVTELW